jgi:hypothetical protein
MVDGGYEHLERRLVVAARSRHMLHDGLEEWDEVRPRVVEIHGGGAVARRGVHYRRVELRIVGLELDEEIEHLVVHAERVRARPVDLVDDHDRDAPQRQRLAQHEARLRHRSVERVHYEQDPVHHTQDTLHLATEVSVSGRIYDVDLDTVPSNCCILGEDRDPAFALERIRIHDTLGDHLIIPERSALAKHLVHECGLPVIYVGDDSNIANFHSP